VVEAPAGTFEEAHLVYAQGELAEHLGQVGEGALLYIEGRNRSQQIRDAGGREHRLAYVEANVARTLTDGPSKEGANAVTLVGTLVCDAEARASADGQIERVKLRVQTHSRETDPFTGRHRTVREYHTVLFFGRAATFVAARAHAGSLVYLDGRNRQVRWQDTSYVAHRTIEVIGHYFQLLHAEPNAARPQRKRQDLPAYGFDAVIPEEEIVPAF